MHAHTCTHTHTHIHVSYFMLYPNNKHTSTSINVLANDYVCLFAKILRKSPKGTVVNMTLVGAIMIETMKLTL